MVFLPRTRVCTHNGAWFWGRIGGEARLPAGLCGRQRRWPSTSGVTQASGLSPPTFAPTRSLSALPLNFKGHSGGRAIAAHLRPKTLKNPKAPTKKAAHPLGKPSKPPPPTTNPLGKPPKPPPPRTRPPKNETISTKCPTLTGEAKNPTHHKSHKGAQRPHQKEASKASDRTTRKPSEAPATAPKASQAQRQRANRDLAPRGHSVLGCAGDRGGFLVYETSW